MNGISLAPIPNRVGYLNACKVRILCQTINARGIYESLKLGGRLRIFPIRIIHLRNKLPNFQIHVQPDDNHPSFIVVI
jgi:hypothetical protein